MVQHHGQSQITEGAVLLLSGLDVLADVQKKTYLATEKPKPNPTIAYDMHRFWSLYPLFSLCPQVRTKMDGRYICLIVKLESGIKWIENVFPRYSILSNIPITEEQKCEIVLFFRSEYGLSDPLMETLRCSNNNNRYVRQGTIEEAQRLEFGNAFANGWTKLGLLVPNIIQDKHAQTRVAIDWTPAQTKSCYGSRPGAKIKVHHVHIIEFLLGYRLKNINVPEVCIKTIIQTGGESFLCLKFQPMLEFHKYLTAYNSIKI